MSTPMATSKLSSLAWFLLGLGFLVVAWYFGYFCGWLVGLDFSVLFWLLICCGCLFGLGGAFILCSFCCCSWVLWGFFPCGFWLVGFVCCRAFIVSFFFPLQFLSFLVIKNKLI